MGKDDVLKHSSSQCDWRHDGIGKRFCVYFVACSFGAFAVAALVLVFWSNMLQLGIHSLSGVRAWYSLSYTCAAIFFLIVFILYVMDFFMPPHLPGRRCVLFEDDALIGPGLTSIAAGSVWLGAMFSANMYPWLPILMTIYLCPVALASVRVAVGSRPQDLDNDAIAALRDDFTLRLLVLRQMQMYERDLRVYYRAAGVALFLAASVALTVWLVWDASSGPLARECIDAQDAAECEIIVISPLFLCGCYYYFTFLCVIRVYLTSTYTKTDKALAQLMEAASTSPDHQATARLEHRPTIESINAMESLKSMSPHARKEYFRKHVRYVRQIESVAGVLMCAFVVLLSSLYAFSLFAEVGKKILLDAVKACMLLAFFAAVGFVYVTFNRIFRAMGSTVLHLPIFKSARAAANSDWARAMLVFSLSLVFPAVLLLSAVNQSVRRCRGLGSPLVDHPENTNSLEGSLVPRASVRSSSSCAAIAESNLVEEKTSEGGGPKLCLTWRVHSFLQDARQWDWLSVLEKVVIIGLVFVMLSLTPILINVLLSWMIFILNPLPLPIIVLAVWLIGLVLFLLPPVPGAPVYLFGGVLIAGKAQNDWGDPQGFWLGAVICILVCLLLKLAACAVQQKCFGETLGNYLWVRQAVGVHKPFVRAIEYALRQPGLCFGKVIILMAGPDWPTSVLAGVLRLSLVQCELGTVPIVLYIAPLSLTGSFYFKRDEGSTWKSLGDLMFIVTSLETVLLWGLMGWVIQDVISKQGDRLSTPKAEYVDLEWLDYREAELAKRTSCTWRQVPFVCRLCFALSAVGCVISGHLFYWAADRCFGEYNITDDINSLSWYGAENSLITMTGLLGLGLTTVSCVLYGVYYVWRKSRSKRLRVAAAKEVDPQEATWKEGYLARAAAAAAEELAANEALLEPSGDRPLATAASLAGIAGVVVAPEVVCAVRSLEESPAPETCHPPPTVLEEDKKSGQSSVARMARSRAVFFDDQPEGDGLAEQDPPVANLEKTQSLKRLSVREHTSFRHRESQGEKKLSGDSSEAHPADPAVSNEGACSSSSKKSNPKRSKASTKKSHKQSIKSGQPVHSHHKA